MRKHIERLNEFLDDFFGDTIKVVLLCVLGGILVITTVLAVFSTISVFYSILLGVGASVFVTAMFVVLKNAGHI